MNSKMVEPSALGPWEVVNADETHEAIRNAGRSLIALCEKDSNQYKRKLLDYERRLFEEAFAIGEQLDGLKPYHIEALKAALRTENYELVRLLLERDPTHTLLEDQEDSIQTALAPLRPWTFSEPHYGCGHHDIVNHGIVDRLIAHGAKIDGVDEHGFTALYYTCARGHGPIFKSLIEAGADYSTVHQRVESCDLECGTVPSDKRQEVNLLQIYLDSRLAIHDKGNTIPDIWTNDLGKGGGLIVTTLIEFGLRVDPMDPSPGLVCRKPLCVHYRRSSSAVLCCVVVPMIISRYSDYCLCVSITSASGSRVN